MRILFAVLLIPALLFAQATPPQPAVPLRTGIEIELLQDLSSETMQSGQIIPFKIIRPVEVKGETIFPADTPVTGKISAIHAAGKWGKNGAMALTLDPLTAPDGSQVNIDFHRPKRQGGEKAEKTGERMEATMFYGYYFPLIPFALIHASRKGEPFTIRKGERYLVYVIAPKDQPTFTATEPPKQQEKPPSPSPK